MLEYIIYLIIVVALANLPVYLWERRRFKKWLVEHNKNHEKEMKVLREESEIITKSTRELEEIFRLEPISDAADNQEVKK